jgi:hypothetical protein
VELSYDATALVNGRRPVAAVLVYDPADPWAITLVVDGVTWLFARELLATGLYEPAGHGDVQVRPDTGGVFGHVVVALSGPSGTADLALPRGTVESLLDATEALVPPGHERIDWETEMVRLTGDDATGAAA